MNAGVRVLTGAFRPLENGEVHLWKCPLDSPGSAEDFLSDEEIRRKERFGLPILRTHFANARNGLRLLAGRYLAKDPRDLRFSYAEHGKPLLEGEALHFNLSHSGGLMVAAFTFAGPLGVDIEQQAPRVHVRDIARRYFSDAECREMGEGDETEFLRNFFRLWTAKEAVMKATALGFALGLSKIRIGLDPLRVVALDWEGPGAWELHGFRPAEDYCGTLACSPGLRVACFAAES